MKNLEDNVSYQERRSDELAATPQGGSKEIYDDVMAARYRSLEGCVVSDNVAL